MNDLAIRARRLSKSYTLYDAPKYRLLDMLGLSGRAAAGRREHRALRDISFDIARGEKVAIIGRNGAGKSTLLKLVTKVIVPTAGDLDIRGETQALLSIGTGFHPEFTGRQNAAAYLTSLGFSGAELDRMVEDAIAFAELDDFADQPIKTYSTGMGMRLMFAAATMIRPDLLVIDEVLGVGDAYFQQKSFQHIRDICSSRQTTLLLVTHDIYNAAQLCDRMMWIDRGRLLIDADPATVMRAYEDSIREQEERRLRAKALGPATRGRGTVRRLLVDIQSARNLAPKTPLYLTRLSILVGGVQVASAPLGEQAFEATDGAVLVREGSNWGDTEQWQGRLARPLRNHGSPFHKVTAAFDLPLKAGDVDRLGVRIEGWSAEPGDLHVRIHGEDVERDLGRLDLTPGVWNDVTLAGADGQAEAALRPSAVHESLVEEAEAQEELKALFSEAEGIAAAEPVPARGPGAEPEPPATPADEAEAASAETAGIRMINPSLNVTGVYGTGDVELMSLTLTGADGRERHIVPVGSTATLSLRYRLKRPDLKEKLNVVFVFRRDGITDVARIFLNSIVFDATTRPEGILKAHFDRLPLGPASYAVTVLVAKEGYYDTFQTQFFTMNPGVYSAHKVLAEFVVEGISQLYSGTGAVVDTAWSLDEV
ncbi:MAG: ABC transporter ATP-binding protein [Proteobacteria bacterium]|nr:ABC transporter ATP-binding protein [Pseudomonadota bacterium]